MWDRLARVLENQVDERVDSVGASARWWLQVDGSVGWFSRYLAAVASGRACRFSVRLYGPLLRFLLRERRLLD